MNWHLETLNGIHFTSPADNQNHRDAKESETEESKSASYEEWQETKEINLKDG